MAYSARQWAIAGGGAVVLVGAFWFATVGIHLVRSSDGCAPGGRVIAERERGVTNLAMTGGTVAWTTRVPDANSVDGYGSRARWYDISTKQLHSWGAEPVSTLLVDLDGDRALIAAGAPGQRYSYELVDVVNGAERAIDSSGWPARPEALDGDTVLLRGDRGWWLVDVTSGEVTSRGEGNPDAIENGTLLYETTTDDGVMILHAWGVTSHRDAIVDRVAQNVSLQPKFDGKHIAFSGGPFGGTPGRVRVLDLATGSNASFGTFVLPGQFELGDGGLVYEEADGDGFRSHYVDLETKEDQPFGDRAFYPYTATAAHRAALVAAEPVADLKEAGIQRSTISLHCFG